MWIDDQILEQCHQAIYAKCFFPKEHMVVCGRSEKPEIEANTENCDKDGVSIKKRRGGGGTVLLGPKTLVISLGVWVNDYYKNKFYFEMINQSVIETLETLNPEIKGKLSQNGISDIVCGAKKIAGTSMYRSRNYLLYQGSLLVDADIQKISKYINHPSKEPEYRNSRKHRDFLLNLQEISKTKTDFDLFENRFVEKIRTNLLPELTEPIGKQVDYLNKQNPLTK